MAVTFKWDARKDAANRTKHDVSFNEALTVFGDPLGRIVPDPRHSHGEIRLTLLGLSVRRRLLAVMFTDCGEDRIRIISARRATRHERHDYEEAGPYDRTTDACRRRRHLAEYDFSAARPNPYANRTAGTSVTVVLDPDVARIFPHAAAVNDALRALSRIAERSLRRPRSKRTSA